MKSPNNFNRSPKQMTFTKRLARKLTATITLTGLLLTSSMPLHAQGQGQGLDLEQVPHGELLTGILSLTTDITQQIGQSRAQTQAMIQSQQMMSQLAPQSMPAQFFPQCQIPVTAPNLPMGYCDNMPSSPVEFEMMNNLMEVAANYERYYKMMLTPAQNSPFPSGMKCLNDGKTAVVSSMVDRQNALQVLIDRINKETQLFRDENERFLKEMDDLNAELHGGATGTNENKSLSFANEFSPECRLIIGSANLTPNAARQGGLMGLQERMRGQKDNAVSYHTKKANIEANYDKIIQKLSSDLSSKGVMDVMNELQNESYFAPGRENFAPVTETIARRGQILEQKRSQVEAELKGILGSDFSLPQLNRTFASDFNRFIQRSDEFYRKKFVGDCVTGKSSGVGLSIDQLIKSLETQAKRETGSNYRRYVERLNAVLSSDSHIEDKMAEISRIDKSFNEEVVLTNFRSESTRGPITPYQFIQQSIAACEAVYLGDQTYSSSGPVVAGASSQKEAVQRAKNLMQEFQSEVSDFQTKLIGEIENRMRSCQGQSLTPASCSEENVFNPGAAGFCLTHASACSGKVQACNARANELIAQRQTKLKVASGQFNAAAEALVTRQEQILNQIRNQVLADAEYLKKYFPGADYKYPEDLFVKMPEQKLRNGEMIYGGGTIDFKDLATNVGKLKSQLAAQSDQIVGVLDKYIQAQTNQIEDNRRDWSQIAVKCSQTANAFAAAQAQQQQEQMAQQNETNQQLADFCRKFNSLASTENPTAGCSGPFSAETLYEDSMKISAHIDNKVQGAIGSYAAICNQTQNEKKRGNESSKDDDDGSFNLLTACKSGSSNIKDELIGEVTGNIPSNLSEHKDAIIAFLEDGTALPDAVTDDRRYHNFLRGIKANFSNIDVATLKTQFEERITALEGTDLSGYNQIVNNRIGNSRDPFCQQVAYNKALEALGSNTDDIKENKKDKFISGLDSSLKTASESFNNITRGIASNSNSAKNDEWRSIGEQISGNCEAYNNVNRQGGLLGELMSNPTQGLDLRSLGIGR